MLSYIALCMEQLSEFCWHVFPVSVLRYCVVFCFVPPPSRCCLLVKHLGVETRKLLVPAERISRLCYYSSAAWVAALSKSLIGRAEITVKKQGKKKQQLLNAEKT